MMLTRASGVAFALSLSFLETYETSPLAGAPGRSLPGAVRMPEPQFIAVPVAVPRRPTAGVETARTVFPRSGPNVPLCGDGAEVHSNGGSPQSSADSGRDSLSRRCGDSWTAMPLTIPNLRVTLPKLL